MTFLYAQSRLKENVNESYRLMETMSQNSYLFLLCDVQVESMLSLHF